MVCQRFSQPSNDPDIHRLFAKGVFVTGIAAALAA
jgi:hypothetical protein